MFWVWWKTGPKLCFDRMAPAEVVDIQRYRVYERPSIDAVGAAAHGSVNSAFGSISNRSATVAYFSPSSVASRQASGLYSLVYVVCFFMVDTPILPFPLSIVHFYYTTFLLFSSFVNTKEEKVNPPPACQADNLIKSPYKKMCIISQLRLMIYFFVGCIIHTVKPNSTLWRYVYGISEGLGGEG